MVDSKPVFGLLSLAWVVFSSELWQKTMSPEERRRGVGVWGKDGGESPLLAAFLDVDPNTSQSSCCICGFHVEGTLGLLWSHPGFYGERGLQMPPGRSARNKPSALK